MITLISVLSHLLLCYVSNNKLCTCFYCFASVRNAFFIGGKCQGVWWLGFLVFIQATQVQFLGRELRSHFTTPLTAVSLKSVPDLRGNVFSFSLLSMMLAVGLSYMAFIVLKYVPSMHTFWRLFIINEC